jgi:hypothetical protein
MNNFIIKGKIKSQLIDSFSDLKIQAMDDDQHWFEDRNDDLLGSSWANEDGSFEIKFNESSFQDTWLERKPEIYLIIRNKDGQIINRTLPTKIEKNNTKNTTIEIDITVSIDSIQKNSELEDIDPYANNNNKILNAFSSLNDIYTLSNSDFIRNFRLLNSSINAWLVYAQEYSWKKIGYDGPQVPKYPRKDLKHNHILSWENQHE